MEPAGKYDGKQDELRLRVESHASFVELPFVEHEHGAFYPVLTFNDNNVTAQLIDPDGMCRAYIRVRYDPISGTPVDVVRSEEPFGLIAALLAYSWGDLKVQQDLRVLGALPSLERLLFVDGLWMLDGESDSIN